MCVHMLAGAGCDMHSHMCTHACMFAHGLTRAHVVSGAGVPAGDGYDKFVEQAEEVEDGGFLQALTGRLRGHTHTLVLEHTQQPQIPVGMRGSHPQARLK